jgi:hypothetical protein
MEIILKDKYHGRGKSQFNFFEKIVKIKKPISSEKGFLWQNDKRGVK